MSKKVRKPIPPKVATEVQFLSDRTCCVCNEKGKQVQIHHIDETPSNNDLNNLSVLCFDCHNLTMIKGGFGRKLDKNQVIKYRDEWIKRVQKRKDKADELASIGSVTGKVKRADDNTIDGYLYDQKELTPAILMEYLKNILVVKNAQTIISQTKWDTGVTPTMNQGNYDLIGFFSEVLTELAKFYPSGHFHNKQPEEYFSEIIQSRFIWHRLILEPEGIGSGGSSVSTMTGGCVLDDLKRMVVNMVDSLAFPYEVEQQIDLTEWKKEWLDEID